ncbi:fibrinogen-like protein 1 isoform X2 [Dreissena polymorpha]|uniref:fibrinogen-like protein 1 isoform X2 n=1 Tax=Dreissena polymorpha TaxID=45954 RepID=UPI0022643649|nr:fibrinogen-like protein 1 isoform X2 [Dreissena polymorpha]
MQRSSLVVLLTIVHVLITLGIGEITSNGNAHTSLSELQKALTTDMTYVSTVTHALTSGITALATQMQVLTNVTRDISARYNQLAFRMSALEEAANTSTLLGLETPVVVRPDVTDAHKAFGMDCAAWYRASANHSGVYGLQPDPSNHSHRFDAFCDMRNGGGWTVIQRREDGSEDFYRSWKSYKTGFGSLRHDFWLGLDKIHALTEAGNTVMRIELTDWDDETRFSEFSYVRVADENDEYRILAGKYTGNGGDPFHTPRFSDRMQSMRFSTYDRDNDLDPAGNCAVTFTSGWWFNSCFLGNLNGVWYGNSSYTSLTSNGIIWDLWTEHARGYSLKKVEIKLRPEVMDA